MMSNHEPPWIFHSFYDVLPNLYVTSFLSMLRHLFHISHKYSLLSVVSHHSSSTSNHWPFHDNASINRLMYHISRKIFSTPNSPHESSMHRSHQTIPPPNPLCLASCPQQCNLLWALAELSYPSRGRPNQENSVSLQLLMRDRSVTLVWQPFQHLPNSKWLRFSMALWSTDSLEDILNNMHSPFCFFP